MITLITAVPGSGKTLYTLDHYKTFSDKENRQVYYSGIPLTEEGKDITGWLELEDPHDWYKLPPGAIVIIDECQRVFPVRKTGASVPEYVSQFETHRHLGIDIVLITQHPNLIDSHVRRLVGRHINIVRLFGGAASTVYSWDGLQENPNTTSVKKACLDTRKFIYPKKVYKWYKSAELHTHKFRLPRRVWLVLALIVLVLVSGSFAAYRLFAMPKRVNEATPVKSQPAATGQPSASPGAGEFHEKRPLTPKEYAEQRQVRVAGKPESAPRYDDLTKPRTFPRLSACVRMGEACNCYTQQGTKIAGISATRCVDYVKNGWFDDYRDDGLNPERRLADQQAVPPPVQVAPPLPGAAGSRVRMFGSADSSAPLAQVQG